MLKSGIPSGRIPSVYSQGRFMVIVELLAWWLVYAIVLSGRGSSLSPADFFLGTDRSGESYFLFWPMIHISMLTVRGFLYYFFPREAPYIRVVRVSLAILSNINWGMAFYSGTFVWDEQDIIIYSILILGVLSAWSMTTIDLRFTAAFTFPGFLLVLAGLVKNSVMVYDIHFSAIYLILGMILSAGAHRLAGRHSLMVDLSENLRVEQSKMNVIMTALKQSESDYRYIVENSNSIILKWNPDGQLIYINDFGLNFLQFDRVTLFEKSIFETIFPRPETADPKASGFDSYPADRIRFETDFTRSDGSTVKIRWHNTNEPRFSAGGLEILTIGLDVTKEYEQFDRLKQQKQELRSILDAIPVPILISGDEEDGFIFSNQSAKLTYYRDKNTDEPLSDEVVFVDPGEKDRLLQKLINGREQQVSGELRLRTTEGYERWALAIFRYFSYRESKVILTVLQDISEIKKSELILLNLRQKAEEANALKDKFVSLVSHDLRGPVSGIQSIAEILSDPGLSGNMTEEEKHNYYAMIQKSSRGLIEMLEQLLNITRLASGKLVPVKKHEDFNLMVESVFDRYRELAGKRKIQLINDIPEKTFIFADKSLFMEVISNLTSNSLKFTPENGSIRIRCSQNEDGFIIIRFEDTGAGIPENILPNLFRHEIKTSLKGLHGEEGTGLGLPYCNDIVSSHGGQMTAGNSETGSALFEIRIPPQRPLILVLDDSGVQKKLITETITADLSADFIEVSDGNNALIILESVVPDMVIAAETISGLSVWQFLLEMRFIPGLEPVPALVITAEADSKKSELGWLGPELGVHSVIRQPVESSELLKKVHHALVREGANLKSA